MKTHLDLIYCGVCGSEYPQSKGYCKHCEGSEEKHIDLSNEELLELMLNREEDEDA